MKRNCRPFFSILLQVYDFTKTKYKTRDFCINYVMNKKRPKVK